MTALGRGAIPGIVLLSLALSTTVWADGDEDLATIYLADVAGGGVATTGVGLSGRYDGIRNMSGTLILTGIPAGANVERAWLYWSTWLAPDDDPVFAGQALIGTLIGVSADTGWTAGANLYAFRADVTAAVRQNGTYLIEGLQSSPLNGDANGAGLLVVYSDPAASTSATIVVSDGARTWCGLAAFTETFTGLAFPEAPSAVTFGLHVADGQDGTAMFPLTDSALDFGAQTFRATFNAADGGMWDRDTFDVLSEFSATTTTASWTYQNDGLDCVQFVSSWLDVRWPDADADLVSDANDNCPAVANPAQTDTDADGVGDACSMPDMGADMGPPDLGVDVGMPDLGPPDLGLPDLGAPDMGPPDLGSLDFGIPDINRDLGRRDLGGPEPGPADMADVREVSPLEPPLKASDGGCCATSSGRVSPAHAAWMLLLGCVGLRLRRAARRSY